MNVFLIEVVPRQGLCDGSIERLRSFVHVGLDLPLTSGVRPICRIRASEILGTRHQSSCQCAGIGHSPCTPFAQFAEPMTALLADLRELTCPLPAFTAFHGHFLSAFLTIFNGGFCCCSAERMSLASWAANRASNLLRARSVAFNVYFLLGSK